MVSRLPRRGADSSSDATKTDNIGLGDPTRFIAGSSRSRNSLLSYLGRVNYNLLDKYLFTASLRIDGSSRFGENNRFGVFPSFAFGWKLDQEEFIEQLGVFSTLKLRTSWGRTGNQEIGNYQSMPTYAAGQKAVIGEVQVSTTSPSRLPNPDLKWKTSEQLNFGLDFGLMQNRISGSVDWFYKDTKDMLLNLAVPRTTGFSTMMTNIGAVRNTGVEFMLNSQNTKGVVRWESMLNFAWLKNNVQDLGTNKVLRYINLVRKRSGLADLKVNDIGGQNGMRDKILLERGHEFYNEGHRRMDMIRVGKFMSDAVRRGKNATPSHVLFPIPQAVIDSDRLIEQNANF